MERSTRLVLGCLSLFLVLAPLGAGKPGLPPTLKGDEPAYYLMAMSLARDGDLRCEPRDLERLFQEFLGRPVKNLILMTDDGWRTVFFGKPYIYPLLAAPWAYLFGANGLVAFNMALLVAMLWMGTVYLARFNPEPLAALFTAGFFFLSTAWVYVFWLHPEILNMAAVTAALFLGLHPLDGEGGGLARRVARRLFGGPLQPAWSAAALAVAVYNKPMLAALGLPILYAYLRRRRFRAAGAWLLGAILASGALAGVSVAFTGHPSAYLGVERAGVNVDDPTRMPVTPRHTRSAADSPTGNSWSWIFRLPDLSRGSSAADVEYFLVGRHTGLFVYMPFSLLCLALFLAHRRRSGVGWVLLGSLVLVAGFFLVWIPFNWHGGGGFVGNRYFVNAYPAFLFLVTSLRPAWSTVAAYAVGGVLLGPLLLSPFGAVVPQPTLQAHVRNFPYRLLPLELSIRERIPGYRGTVQLRRWFMGRKDVFRPTGDELWIHGSTPVELFVYASQPLTAAVFQVRDVAPENRIRLRMGADSRELRFTPDGPRSARVELEPGKPYKVLRRWNQAPTYIYRLLVHADHGRQPPPTPGLEPVSFDLGAALAFLGTPEELEQDLYAATWSAVEAPERVAPGSEFRVSARLTNASEASWPARGPTRVALAYHWLTADGAEPAVWEGLRTPLPVDVAPGQSLDVSLTVRAPETPGTYRLALDAVRERVAWFSERRPESLRTLALEVTEATP